MSAENLESASLHSFILLRAKPSMCQVLLVIWESEMNDSSDTCSLHVPGGGLRDEHRNQEGDRPEKAGASTGRWWDLGLIV